MSVPIKPLLALGIAFVAGVGVTAAYVGAKPERPMTHEGKTSGISDGVAASDAAKEASPTGPTKSSAKGAPDNRSAANGWVDPVKQPAVATPTRQPLPPLVFNLDEKQKSAPKRVSNEPEQRSPRRIDQPIVAQATPPRRPEASELVAHQEINRPLAVASVTTDRTLLSQRVAEATSRRTQTLPLPIQPNRKPSTERTASLAEKQDRLFPSATKQSQHGDVIRDAYPDVSQHYYTSSRNSNVDFRQRVPQIDRRGYRQASTSETSSGVMRWLNQ